MLKQSPSLNIVSQAEFQGSTVVVQSVPSTQPKLKSEFATT